MANSITGGMGTPQNPTFGANGMPNTEMLQQFQNFQKMFKGDPKQAVMQMMSQGKIGNGQLQQAMQMARQMQGMLK